jgi:hypothetical protein
MDQYSKSGVVGRGATKSTAELGEKLFTMVVDALVPMVKNALEEDKPKPRTTIMHEHNSRGKRKTKTGQIASRGRRNNDKK